MRHDLAKNIEKACWEEGGDRVISVSAYSGDTSYFMGNSSDSYIGKQSSVTCACDLSDLFSPGHHECRRGDEVCSSKARGNA